MSVKVNGRVMSTESAMDLLNKETTRVTKLSLDLPAPQKKRKEIEPNSEGFAIPKALISELCRTMDRMNADRIKYTLSGSPYILKRTLTLTMEIPRPEPKGLKKLLRKFAEWLLEKTDA